MVQKTPWPSGKAKVCNTSIPGPIPGGASKTKSTSQEVLFCFGYATYKSPGTACRRHSRIRVVYSATERVELARKRQGVNIFAKGEIPGVLLFFVRF